MGALPAGDRLRTRRPGLGRDDGGQLMLLAGVVITLSFIMTALTLAQVSQMEREAASQAPSTLSAQWRFIHDRLATNLQVGVTPQLSNQTLENATFPAIVATFRNIQTEKGYDTVVRIANGSAFPKREASLVLSNGSYDVWTSDGKVRFTHGYDGVDDGIITRTPCPAPGSSGTCIVGVLVYARLSEARGSVEETILIAVNQG